MYLYSIQSRILEATIKLNYLNNRDLLKEIHQSKSTYCTFTNPIADHQYDIILHSVSAINEHTIQQAKLNKAALLLKEHGTKVDASTISNQDLVFRVMTWEHIPLLPPKIAKPVRQTAGAIRIDTINKFFEEVVPDVDVLDVDVSEIEIEELIDPAIKKAIDPVKSQHIRINFPPFWHYKLNEKMEPYVVGKSHWKGDLETGSFCKNAQPDSSDRRSQHGPNCPVCGNPWMQHGAMTDKLALMLMKLAEKFSLKSNWRGYSYRDEMQGQAILQLCQVALQFDESKSQNPFAFLTSVSHNSFLRILNMEKKNQQLRDKILIENHMNPSYSHSNTNKDMQDWSE